MPASPTSSPRRRPLNEQFRSQGDKLQIRLVPYSPPRLSSDGSAPSRPVSSIDNPPLHLSSDNIEIHGQGESPRDATSSVSSFTIPVPTRDSNRINQEPHSDAEHSEFISDTTPEVSLSKSLERSLSSSPSLASLSSTSPSLSSSPSWRRPKRVINVHADKTFSLAPQSGLISSRADPSTPRLSTTPSSSYVRLSSSGFGDDRPSSSLTSLAEHGSFPALPTSPATSLNNFNHASESPWGYGLVGGLRKVQSNASDCSHRHSSQFSQGEILPSPAEITQAVDGSSIPPLTTKQSFQSSATGSTLSDRTNYKVYDRSSPVIAPIDDSTALDFDSPPPSSSNSNYVILGDSASADHSLENQSRPQSEQSDVNYVIHGDLSCSSSIVTTSRPRVRPEYSRESLVVAPLRPTKLSRPEKQLIVAKSQSRDFHETGSLTSMSNLITNQEATRAPIAGSVTVSIPGGMDWQKLAVPSNSEPTIHRGSFSRPQQWSTTLSTVFSESERESEPPSRSLSRLSSNGRNVVAANRSRRIGSFSSSAGIEDPSTIGSHSRNISLERPQPVYNRDMLIGNSRLIRDQDEDGDGLADLEELHRRPSRVRHHSLLSSYSSDRNLRSSGSSRANSLNYASIPAWARLYYGSGERRFLITQPSYESMFSQFSDSQPRNSILSRSPSYECFTTDINNPRRRPREDQSQAKNTDSMEIAPHPLLTVARNLKKQTSSIWSPHLRQDRRANQHSIWAPPSLAESTGNQFWRRNMQIVLFVLGFILPFLWMIGALMPLPPKPQLEMMERDHSTSHLDLRLESRHQMQDMNEIRLHNRTKWWRSVNRRMSVLGIFLIGAYVTLIVVGVKQQWSSR